MAATKYVVLLRGVNIGARNRVAMPKLRAVLAEAGFDEVQTYVQSGNVVLSSPLPAAKVESRCRRAIADGFGLDVDVVVRTRRQLAAVVERNPLKAVATEPKRYQVAFLSAKLDRKTVHSLAALASGGERFAAHGRELYAWHPNGVGRSKLAAKLAGKNLGVAATSRNWTTVTKLLELASE